MEERTSELRWNIERRLEFIEFRLYWEGGINRADIVDQFGLSVPQASKDLSRYQVLAPNNLAYDKRKKRYFPAPGFSPRFLRAGPRPISLAAQSRGHAFCTVRRNLDIKSPKPRLLAGIAP